MNAVGARSAQSISSHSTLAKTLQIYIFRGTPIKVRRADGLLLEFALKYFSFPWRSRTLKS